MIGISAREILVMDVGRLSQGLVDRLFNVATGVVSEDVSAPVSRVQENQTDEFVSGDNNRVTTQANALIRRLERAETYTSFTEVTSAMASFARESNENRQAMVRALADFLERTKGLLIEANSSGHERESNIVSGARNHAVRALGNIGSGSNEEISTLIGIIADEQLGSNHRSALQALQRLSSHWYQIVNTLYSRLGNVRNVRAASNARSALNSLTNLQGEGARNALRGLFTLKGQLGNYSLHDSINQVADGIINSSEDKIGLLLPLLQEQDPAVKRSVLEKLDQMWSLSLSDSDKERMSRAIIPLLRDSDPNAQKEALDLLRRMFYYDRQISSEVVNEAGEELSRILKTSTDPAVIEKVLGVLNGILSRRQNTVSADTKKELLETALDLLENNNSPRIKEKALQLLSKVASSVPKEDTDRVVELVLPFLSSEDSSNISSALDVLRDTIGNASPEVKERVIEELTHLICHENKHIRRQVATVLGRTGSTSPTVVNALIDLICDVGDDYDYSIQAETAKSLAAIGNGSIDVALRLIPIANENGYAGGALASIADSLSPEDKERLATELLNNLNRSEEPGYRIIRALGKTGEHLPPALKAQAFNKLASIANDSDPFISAIAVHAFVSIGGANAPEALRDSVSEAAITLLTNEFIHPAETAARALGKMGHPKAIQALINIVGDTNTFPSTRIAAIEELTKHASGNYEIIEGLISGLGAPEMEVRDAAANALGSLGPDAVVQLLDKVGDMSTTTIGMALRRIGKNAIDILEEALTNENSQIASTAATNLAEIVGMDGVKVSSEQLDRIVNGIINIAANENIPRGRRISAMQSLAILGGLKRRHDAASTAEIAGGLALQSPLQSSATIMQELRGVLTRGQAQRIADTLRGLTQEGNHRDIRREAATWLRYFEGR